MNTKRNEIPVTDIMAPMFAITMEFDAHLSVLLQKEFDMSLANFKVLRAVYMLDRPTQSRIACFMHVSEAAVSKRVKILTQKKLLKRMVHKNDKRASVLELSAEGAAQMRSIQKSVVRNTEVLFADLSDTKRKKAVALLQTIYKMVSIKEQGEQVSKKECILHK